MRKKRKCNTRYIDSEAEVDDIDVTFVNGERSECTAPRDEELSNVTALQDAVKHRVEREHSAGNKTDKFSQRTGLTNVSFMSAVDKAQEKSDIMADNVFSKDVVDYKIRKIGETGNEDKDSDSADDLSCVMDNTWYSVKARVVEGGVREFVFVCKVCGKLSHRRGNMDDHVRSHAGIKPFQCQLCENKFSRKQNLKNHFLKIHGLSEGETNELLMEVDLPAPAVNCRQIRQTLNFSLTSDESFKSDMAYAEEKESSFTALTQLAKQEDGLVNKDTDLSPVKMEEENTSDIDNTESLSEQVENVPFKTFLSQNDNADFKNKTKNNESSLLEKGFEIIEDYGTFICLAPKTSTHSSKIYQCKICSYECMRRYTMRTHTWTHTGVKRYICELCDNAFTRNTYLKIHLSKAHSVTGPDLDDMIKRVSENAPHGIFTSSKSEHFMSASPSDFRSKSYVCPGDVKSELQMGEDNTGDDNDISNTHYVDKGFKVVSTSRAQTLPNKTRHDSEVLEKVQDFGNFMSIEVSDNVSQSKVYRCKVCSYECTRRYTMKQHSWTHTGYKRFSCSLCGNSFTRSTYFRFHLRKAHSITGIQLDIMVRNSSIMRNVSEQNIDNSHDNLQMLVPNGKLSVDFGHSEDLGIDSDSDWVSHSSLEADGIDMKTNSNVMDTDNKSSAEYIPIEFDLDASGNKEREESSTFSSVIDTEAASDFHVEQSSVTNETTNDRDLQTTSIHDSSTESTYPTENIAGKTPSILMSPNPNQETPNDTANQNEFPESVTDIIDTLMDVDNLQCLKCLKTCSSKGNLKAHIKTHFNIKPYACPVCFKQFGKRGNMREHARIMHRFIGPLLSTDSQSSDAFASVSACPDADNIYSEDTDASIKDNDISTEQVKPILEHEREESNNDNLKQAFDDLTESSADQSQILNEFSLMDAANLQCKKCLKVCTSKGNLKAHVRLHFNLRPFTCPLCPKTFNKKSNMRFHARRMHNLSLFAGTFAPDLSGKDLSNSYSLKHYSKPLSDEIPTSAHSSGNVDVKVRNEVSNNTCSSDIGNSIKPENTSHDELTSTSEEGGATKDSLNMNIKNKIHDTMIQTSDSKESVATEMKSEDSDNVNFENLAEEIWGYNMLLLGNTQKQNPEMGDLNKDRLNLLAKDKVDEPQIFFKQDNTLNKKDVECSAISSLNTSVTSCVEKRDVQDGALDLSYNSGIPKSDTYKQASDTNSPFQNILSPKFELSDLDTSYEQPPDVNASGFNVAANDTLPNEVYSTELRMLMDEEKLQCTKCLKRFANKWSLKAHVKSIHLQGKQYVCSVCHKAFNYKCNLERHYSVHFPDGINRLKTADESPKKQDTTTTENKTEKNVERNKLCTEENSNKGHEPMKLDGSLAESESQNTIMEEADSSGLLLENYMDLETFQCRKCLKQFANKWSLKAHVKSIHLESRKHVCHVCQKSFNHKCNLDRHIVLHPSYSIKKGETSDEFDDAEKIQCMICRKTFANKWSLKAHVKSIHLHSRQFVCTVCGKSFNHKCNLERHIVLHESGGTVRRMNEIESDDSVVSLSNDSGDVDIVTEETDTPSFDERLLMDMDKLKCIKCGKICSNKSNLKSHVKLHLNLRHVCKICQASFDTKDFLKKHYNIHIKKGETDQRSLEDNDSLNNSSIPEALNESKNEEVLKTEEELPVVGSEQDGPVYCGMCGHKFESRTELHKHFDTHEGF